MFWNHELLLVGQIPNASESCGNRVGERKAVTADSRTAAVSHRPNDLKWPSFLPSVGFRSTACPLPTVEENRSRAIVKFRYFEVKRCKRQNKYFPGALRASFSSEPALLHLRNPIPGQ